MSTKAKINKHLRKANILRDMNLQIQEAQQTPGRINTKIIAQKHHNQIVENQR